MASSGGRKRRRTDDSFQTNFRELRDRGVPDTGPKRPKGRRTVALTPAVAKPTLAKKQGSRGKKGRAEEERSRGEQRKGKRTPRTRLKEDIKDLIEGAVRLGDVTPAKPRTSLTPYVTPEIPPPPPAAEGASSAESDHPSQSASSGAITPAATTDTDVQKGRSRRRSNEKSLVKLRQTPESRTVEETPDDTGDTRVLRSALKGIHSLSSLQKSALPSSSHQVSFGPYVTVTEYSPEKARDSVGDSTSDSSFFSPPSTAKATGRSSAAHHTSLRTDLEPLEGEEEEEGDYEQDVEGREEAEEKDDEEEEEEGEGEEQMAEEDELSDSERVKMKTPRVMPRTRKVSPKETTPRSKETRKSQKVVTRKGRKQTQQTKQYSKHPKTLSRTLIKNLFMLSSKRRLTTEAADLVVKFSELYLKQCSEDLVTYSSHAGRKTVEIEDVILLLKRQRCINDTETFEYLVNTYLPLEYVEELLPCAVAGKKIVPSRLK